MNHDKQTKKKKQKNNNGVSDFQTCFSVVGLLNGFRTHSDVKSIRNQAREERTPVVAETLGISEMIESITQRPTLVRILPARAVEKSGRGSCSDIGLCVAEDMQVEEAGRGESFL